MHKTFQQQKRGFMLIELSIAIVVIGLMFAGVSSGVALIERAKIAASVRQIKQLENAIKMFEASFDAKLGNLMNTRRHFENSITDGINLKWICDRKTHNGGASLAAEGKPMSIDNGRIEVLIDSTRYKVDGVSGASMHTMPAVSGIRNDPTWISIAMCQLYASKFADIPVTPAFFIKPGKNLPALKIAPQAAIFYINDRNSDAYLAMAGETNVSNWGNNVIFKLTPAISGKTLQKLAVKLNSGTIAQDQGKLRAANAFNHRAYSEPVVSNTNCSYDSNTKGCVGLYKLSD